MLKHLYMGDMNPEKFADRLKKLNKYLLYFPTKEGQNSTQLAEDELIDIMDNAKKFDWHIIMLSQGRRPDTFKTMEEAEACYKQLYQADQMRKTLTKAQNKGNTGEKKRKRDHNGDGGNADKFKNKCPHCGKCSHKPDDCWSLEKNKNKHPKNSNHNNGSASNQQQQKTFTTEEVNAMIAGLPCFKELKEKGQKRKIDDDDSIKNFMAQLELEDTEHTKASDSDNVSD